MVEVFDGKFAERKLCQSYSVYTIKVCFFLFLSKSVKVFRKKFFDQAFGGKL
jgi:hypothetical protein